MITTVKLEFGMTYHIYNRGNNGENLFRSPKNYIYFLQLYTKYIYPVADTYAYSLLPNHFHFLTRMKDEEEIAERPLKEPSQYFSNLFNAYTRAFNPRHKRTGTLFERPFGRIPVTSARYFYNLIAYIHRNPQKHGFVDDFRDWPYSSYHAILSDQPTRLGKTAVLSWFDGRDDFIAAHQTDADERLIAHLIAEDGSH